LSGPEQEYARRITAAFSAIVDFPILVTPDWQPSLSEIDTIARGADLDSLMRDRGVSRNLAVVVPEFVVPGVRRGTSDADYNAARRKQDDLFTASLHEIFRRKGIQADNRSAVFVQPDSEEWVNGFWDSMRSLAGFIARQAREAAPLPPDETVALWEKVLNWLSAGSVSRIPLGNFLRDFLEKRFQQIRMGLVAKCVASVKSVLIKGFRAFEVEPNATVEMEAALEPAIADFRLETEALPWPLRNVVTMGQWELAINDLRFASALYMPELVADRRTELEKEFIANCSAAFETTVKQGKEALGWSASWTPQVEAEWRERFATAVHYKDLPPRMQNDPFLEKEYRYWREWAVDRLCIHVEFRSDLRQLAILLAINVVVFAVFFATWRLRHKSTA
jgi:hypothetical protein